MRRAATWVVSAALGLVVAGCGTPEASAPGASASSSAASPATASSSPATASSSSASASSATGAASTSATATASAPPRASTPASPTTTPADSSRTSPSSARPAAGAFERPSRGGVEFAPTGAGALSGRRVLVDPGHNGVYDAGIDGRQVPSGGGQRKDCNTSGTANASTSEHALNWAVASLLVTDLRARGATVWVTRPDDRGVGPCVDERAAIGNRVGADAVVSIHADGNASPTARGFHVITSTTMAGGARVDAASQALARLVRDRMVTTGMPVSTYLGRDGIDVRSDIAGVNLSLRPAVMIEMGNMAHPLDAALLARPGFRASVAAALADAVTSAVG